MKTVIALGVALALVSISGCQSGSPQGGIMEKDHGFWIMAPRFTLDMDQGDVKTIRISLKRGDYFKQDVRLRISVPENLTIDPNNVLVKASDPPNVEVHITAATDAALGKYRISVKGTPVTGQATETEFVMRVKAR